MKISVILIRAYSICTFSGTIALVTTFAGPNTFPKTPSSFPVNSLSSTLPSQMCYSRTLLSSHLSLSSSIPPTTLNFHPLLPAFPHLSPPTSDRKPLAFILDFAWHT